MPARRCILICDLDGTLVDSFQGIATAVRTAYATAGLQPVVSMDRSMIGPPLDDLLRAIGGRLDSDDLGRLRRAFIDAYDGGACTLSAPFEGVGAMLAAIRARGHVLALATNKRLSPTRRILHALGWTDTFALLETVDSRAGNPRPKSQMLADICTTLSCAREDVFYLGDTDADVAAARDIGVKCILAAWAATKISSSPDFVAATPRAVIDLLERPA